MLSAMFPNQILPYLQLCRFAAVFTALADICAGLSLSGQLTPWKPANTWLLLSSAGLYLAGMVLNDLFDRRIDAVERPKRPIPSGRVSVRNAAIFAGSLLLAGVTSAALAGRASGTSGGSVQPLVVALMLTAAILIYDGAAKSTAMGPVVMGSCRFLNVILGASLAHPQMIDPATGSTHFSSVWSAPQVYVAGALWVYISGVTLFARNEAGQSRRSALASAIGVVNAGLVLLAAYLCFTADPDSRRLRSLAALVMVALVINRGAFTAWKDPQPGLVQTAVRTMLQWLILLDAIVVFHSHPDPAAAILVASLLLPARLIGRSLAIT